MTDARYEAWIRGNIEGRRRRARRLIQRGDYTPEGIADALNGQSGRTPPWGWLTPAMVVQWALEDDDPVELRQKAHLQCQ